MYCVSVDWIVLLFYYVYFLLKFIVYDFLLYVCVIRSLIIYCILKGWMNLNIFFVFIDYFDNNVDKNDRLVIFLIDSVILYINMDIFIKVGSRGIEIYMLVLYVIYLM